MSPLPAFRRLGLLWLPILLVLLARMAVAPGWMVEQRADGSISVRICSDPDRVGQTTQIAIDRSADHAPDDQQHCSWGTLADAPPLPLAPPLSEVALLPRTPSVGANPWGFAPGTASPLPPSTGPPSFA